jgi:hypothetical protein
MGEIRRRFVRDPILVLAVSMCNPLYIQIEDIKGF